MIRLAFVLLLVAPVAAAPVPKDFKKALPVYFPLNAGDEWVYESAQEVRVVTGEVTEKDGARTATLATFVGEKEVASETIRVDKGGVFRTHVNGDAIEPPLMMVSFDPVKENKWPVAAKVTGTEIAGTYAVAGKEDIEVPAGKFATVRVVADLKIGGTPSAVTFWFAEGVGQVKVSFSLAGSEAVLELKEYKPAKK